MTTANDMIEMLRRHYLPAGKPPAGIFAPEIHAPDGTRRADLIFQGCTAASGDELIGHEVKVSRADVLVELDDPAKSDPWQRYCNRWWLVVAHPSLIDGLTLPPSWGVMAPPSGRRTRSMTVIVPAPQLNPVNQAPALRTLATWLHWRHHNAANKLARAEAEVQRLWDANRDLLARAEHEPRNQAAHEQVVSDIVTKLGGVESSGYVGAWATRVPVDDVVAALRDLGAVYHQAQTVGFRVTNAVRDFNRLAAGIDTRTLVKLADAAQRFNDPAPARPEEAA